ncbi:phage tail tube protein [Thioalkalivibrio sp. ALMg9]|uniref:phage tail tube protein n=1 Tax=Thioalkalivibrio sp. ALMg9 TaxID=1266912 RepID=UPI00036D5087|nr:phage tail tube protein [Thioalkalivibrio sp. ALMg9]
MTQITGKATVKVDGDELLADANATLNPGGNNREAVLGPRGVQGFREESVAPELEVTVRHTENTDLIALARITNATVTFETDTGDAYLLRRAFTTEPPPLSSGEGNVTMRMSAYAVERI